MMGEERRAKWRIDEGNLDKKSLFLESGTLEMKLWSERKNEESCVLPFFYLCTSHASDCTVLPDTPYLSESYAQKDPQPCKSQNNDEPRRKEIVGRCYVSD